MTLRPLGFAALAVLLSLIPDGRPRAASASALFGYFEAICARHADDPEGAAAAMLANGFVPDVSSTPGDPRFEKTVDGVLILISAIEEPLAATSGSSATATVNCTIGAGVVDRDAFEAVRIWASVPRDEEFSSNSGGREIVSYSFRQTASGRVLVTSANEEEAMRQGELGMVTIEGASDFTAISLSRIRGVQ